MRLCFISDTHGFHNELEVPPCDVLVHTGDWSLYGEWHEAVSFLDWFKSQEAVNKIYLNGNHEVYVTKQNLMPNLIEKYPDLTYLENSSVEIDGVKFYGSPYTPEFYPEHWVYQLKAKDAKALWALIPLDTDVLLSHGPPHGFRDNIITNPFKADYHAGCPDLTVRIKEVKPAIAAFGHIHPGYGIQKLANPAIPTLFVNAAVCNDAYRVVNKPHLIDLVDNVATVVDY